jgi:hypothetical protein
MSKGKTLENMLSGQVETRKLMKEQEKMWLQERWDG